ncbi:MAG: tetratricopeptide repeat protein, partial [Cyanobacteria bacterium P01_C01_bin.147]
MLSTLWAAILLTADIPTRLITQPLPLIVVAQAADEASPEAAFRTGMTAFQANDYAGAIAAWETALNGFQAANDQTQVTLTLNALAAATLSLSRHSDAIAYASDSAALAQTIKRPDLEAQALGNLGIAYQASGQFAKAVETYERALTRLADQEASAAIAQLYGL